MYGCQPASPNVIVTRKHRFTLKTDDRFPDNSRIVVRIVFRTAIEKLVSNIVSFFACTLTELWLNKRSVKASTGS